MKRIIMFAAVIFCLTSCYTPWNDFEFGDDLTFSAGEKLYESASAWLRCDSLIYDADALPGVYHDTSDIAACYFTVHYEGMNKQLVLITDSIRSKSLLYPDGQLIYIRLLSVAHLSEADHSVNVRTSLYQYEDMVEKPNIYLYPQEPSKINLSLYFPDGGQVSKSIPQYPEKWQDISVNTDGRINSRYDFLFYEAGVSDAWQYSHGWVVKRENLSLFFQLNMEEYGFNRKEIEDFLAYWIPALNLAPYYAVYPQTSTEIDPLIQIHCDPEPDSMLRLFYVFREMGGFIELPQPLIENFSQDGFVLREWGGIRK